MCSGGTIVAVTKGQDFGGLLTPFRYVELRNRAEAISSQANFALMRDRHVSLQALELLAKLSRKEAGRKDLRKKKMDFISHLTRKRAADAQLATPPWYLWRFDDTFWMKDGNIYSLTILRKRNERGEVAFPRGKSNGSPGRANDHLPTL